MFVDEDQEFDHPSETNSPTKAFAHDHEYENTFPPTRIDEDRDLISPSLVGVVDRLAPQADQLDVTAQRGASHCPRVSKAGLAKSKPLFDGFSTHIGSGPYDTRVGQLPHVADTSNIKPTFASSQDGQKMTPAQGSLETLEEARLLQNFTCNLGPWVRVPTAIRVC